MNPVDEFHIWKSSFQNPVENIVSVWNPLAENIVSNTTNVPAMIIEIIVGIQIFLKTFHTDPCVMSNFCSAFLAFVFDIVLYVLSFFYFPKLICFFAYIFCYTITLKF